MSILYKKNPACYELYDVADELLYIGSTGNLSERFKHYWNTSFDNDSCMRQTKSYKRGYTSTVERARTLEEECLENINENMENFHHAMNDYHRHYNQ